MLVGKVIGTVVATKKDPEIEGLRLMVVREVDTAWQATGKIAVCVDAVSAGIGEYVLFSAGSAARQTRVTQNRPVDHVIMAVVDLIEIDGKVVYDKFKVDSASLPA